jgi:aryl sulfotransferase
MILCSPAEAATPERKCLIGHPGLAGGRWLRRRRYNLTKVVRLVMQTPVSRAFQRSSDQVLSLSKSDKILLPTGGRWSGMAKFIWLASYPKSGNTWLRFLIASLIRGPIKSSVEVARQIPDVHNALAGVHLFGRRTTVIKTHWKFWTEMPLREDTIGAVYIIRNPIDVLESNQNYAFMRSGNLRKEASPEEIKKAAGKLADDFIAHGGHPRFKEFGIGTWEENVRSWTWPDISLPRRIIRYEDLVAHPEEKLSDLARFLDLKRTDKQVAAAVAACSKGIMRAIEEKEIADREEGIFFQKRNSSNIDAGHRFVDRGIDGKSLFRLTPEQRRRAVERFAPIMTQFGYIPSKDAPRVARSTKVDGKDAGKVQRPSA